MMYDTKRNASRGGEQIMIETLTFFLEAQTSLIVDNRMAGQHLVICFGLVPVKLHD